MKNLYLVIILLLSFVSCIDENDSIEYAPSFELSPLNLDFGEGSQEREIRVESMSSDKIEITVGNDTVLWCSASFNSGVFWDIITVSVAENEGVDVRETVITVKCDGLSREIKVSQLGQTRAILVDPDSLSLKGIGGKISFKITANVEYEIFTPEWVKKDTQTIVEDENYSYIVDANYKVFRTGEILIKEVNGETQNKIIINQEDNFSKMTITAIGDNTVNWSEGDKLSLYAVKAMGGSIFGQEFNISGGQNTKDGTFEGFLTPQSEPVFAAYPYSTETRFTTTTYTADFVMEQIQDHDGNGLKPTSIRQYAYMSGLSEGDVNSTTGVVITMKQLTAILEFKITDIPSDTKINSLILKASSSIIPNKVEVNLVDGTSSFPSKVDLMKVNLKSDGTDGVTASGDFTIRLAMLPTTLPAGENFTITFQTVKDGVTKTYSDIKLFNSEQVFEAGKIYPIALAIDYPMYPKLDITDGSYSFYVYDRNSGTNVPGLDAYPAGETKNWINGSAESDDNVKSFKGDYYSYTEATDGRNSMCPSGWRIPNNAEMTVIASELEKNSNVLTLTGTNEAVCYFPVSGYTPDGVDGVSGYYWTNTPKYYLNLLEKTTTSGGEAYKYSVRCVKTDGTVTE